MNKKKVISVSLIALLILAVAGASVISYLLGNKDGKKNILGTQTALETITDSKLNIEGSYTSNIDAIIANSYDGETFNVVEITPNGVASSGLESYISSGSFTSYVINMNKTDADGRDMNPALSPNVKYTLLTVNSTTSLSDPVGSSTYQEILDAADLIYVSSPEYNSYTGTNNMSEDVYNWLHNYSLSIYRPIIIDYVTDSGSSNTQKKYKTLMNDIANNYIRFRTFYWDEDWTADDFFHARNGSNYLKFNTNKNAATGKVAWITSGSAVTTDHYIKDRMAGYTSMGDIYYGGGSIPTAFTFDAIAPANVASTDFSGYDFIILDNDVAETNISNEAYSLLKSLSEQSKYILFSKGFVKTGGNEVDTSSSNYRKLMDLLVTNKGVAKYSSVLSVSYGFFSSLNSAGEAGIESAQAIAELINASDYRGSLTSGANGKKYRVLELQPCYPIDLEVALNNDDMTGNTKYNPDPTKVSSSYGWSVLEPWAHGGQGNKTKIGDYYTYPDQVLSGVSEDQVDGQTEYYKFELSVAKLAKATGLHYNQIQLDQMSTEAFISKKDVVLETYDLVYIGGNTTALTPMQMKSFYVGYYGPFTDYYPTYSITQFMTCFDMYTHTGIPAEMFFYGSQACGGNRGDAYGRINNSTSYTPLNGNDLTLIKYNELVAYIDAGMPIIFSDKIASAYDAVADSNRINQLAAHDIDPDSRMFKLLEYARKKAEPYIGNDKVTMATVYDAEYNATTTVTNGNQCGTGNGNNILWGLDLNAYVNDGTSDYNENVDGKYTSANPQYVTLFQPAAMNAIVDVINNSETRPSVRIVKQPKTYSQGNETTYNENKNGKMVITAKAVPADASKDTAEFTLKLLIDKDGNGTFQETGTVEIGTLETKELVDTQVYQYKAGSDSTVDLTYTFDYDDFYGLVSWKVVAVETGSKGAVDVASGYAYYKKNEETDKKEVNLLEIMPVNKVDNPSDNHGDSDGHSLYLCTECQMAKYRATYNLTRNGDIYSNVSGVYSSHGNVKDLGLHEHKFGINKYDTAGQVSSNADTGNGSEDWDDNYADALAEDYEFNTTVLFTSELNEISKVIAGNTDADGKLVTTTVDENGQAFGVDDEGNTIRMTWVDYYTAKAEDYYSEWESAKNKLERSKTEEALIEFLTTFKEGAPYTVTMGPNTGYVIDAEKIQQWIDHEAYYNYFLYYEGYSGSTGTGSFNDLYAKWVPYHDAVVTAHENYVKYSCYAYTSEEWLYNNFDIVILGYAEDFGGKDLTVQECKDIKSYIEKGGNVLTTHDTTTRYANSGSINLTNELRSVFGIDRYHITGAEGIENGSYTTNMNSHSAITVSYGKDSSGTDIRFGMIRVSNKNLTVKIDVSAWNDVGNRVYIGSNKWVCSKNITIEEGAEVPVGGSVEVRVEFYTDSTYTTVDHTQDGIWINWNTVKKEELAYGGNGGVTSGVFTFSVGPYSTQSVSNLKYPVYTTADPEKYYATQYVISETNTVADHVLFEKRANESKVANGGGIGYLSLVGYTDACGLRETSSNNSSPYLYAQYAMQTVMAWNMAVTQSATSGTTRASQVNSGIITTYPFAISSELHISGTHNQTFALDLEDDGATAWYTLAGCAGTSGNTLQQRKERSSLFAASPYDGMDSYFLYTYHYGKGTVNYCGAGHTVVTGAGRNNNDERMLYINVIVNAVRNKGSKPKITIHEKDKPNKVLTDEDQSTNPYKIEEGTYVYTVDERTAIPEMDYKVKVNSQTTLKEMYVFYDLNYGITGGDYSNKYTKDKNHVLVYHYLDTNYDADLKAGYIEKFVEETEDGSSSTVTAKDDKNPLVGKLKKDLYMTRVDGEDVDQLQLKAEYFEPYGTYTYLVIWAKDANGKIGYQRIKINLVPKLFDLTKANYETDKGYQGSKRTSDITDRIKFDM